MNVAKRRKLTHKYCPHCKKECNIKTYKDHKRLFFNPESKAWYQESANESATHESDEDCNSIAELSSDEELERQPSPPLMLLEDDGGRLKDPGVVVTSLQTSYTTLAILSIRD